VKRIGIGILITFGVLSCGRAALADVDSFPMIDDHSATNGPFALGSDVNGLFIEDATREGGYVDTAGIVTAIGDPSAINAPFPFEVNDSAEIAGLFQNSIGGNFFDRAGTLTAIHDSGRMGRLFDDGAGHSGFRDDYTVATFTDPRAGGEALAVIINFHGQIVGEYYGDIRIPYQADPAVSEASEPTALPILAGSLILFALTIRRKLKRRRHFAEPICFFRQLRKGGGQLARSVDLKIHPDNKLAG
jgi:hypothetical protein